MRNSQVQKLKLVSEGSDAVTVPMGEVAFLSIKATQGLYSEDRVWWMEILIIAMNFLQSGSPEVRIWSDHLHRIEEDHDREGQERLQQQLDETLLSLWAGLNFGVKAEIRQGGGVIILEKFTKEWKA